VAADEHLGLQFDYDNPELGTAKVVHRVTARAGANSLGTMLWNSRSILNIGVNPEQARRGIATAMWDEGHRLAEQNARIPAPKHSPDRTAMGDAWAKAVGGRLPRRSRG
jgi:ribosomal protein S18 acetylase RimI-like enzyme